MSFEYNKKHKTEVLSAEEIAQILDAIASEGDIDLKTEDFKHPIKKDNDFENKIEEFNKSLNNDYDLD
jgi:7-cyano-7-deazaguanine synthase in queuosine biosynthesis